MFATPSLVLLVLAAAPMIQGHTLHWGGDCANVEPMSGFQMNLFLGKWYVIQKTSTASRCMTYTFQKTEYRKLYNVQQISENAIVGLVKDNTYKYTGELEIIDENKESDMRVKFPLNVIGKSSFIVFATDYDTYAGIYTCQTMGISHRHSATILSREPTMESATLEKVRNRLSSFNVNPFNLNSVNQTNCSPHDYTIDINKTTFDKENIKKTLKKVGTAIGDGVDFLVKGAEKVYTSVKNSHKNGKEGNSGNTDREELSEDFHAPSMEPSAELL